MGLGFRVGVPGLRLRVSTRGVRASVGPRIARVHVGGGRTRVSSGVGPFYASAGSRRSRSRSIPHRPTAAQLDRARRAAARAEEQARLQATIAELNELYRHTTSVHLEEFPAVRRPEVPAPPALDRRRALKDAERHHLAGTGRFARGTRTAARAQAARDADAYLADEQLRLAAVHRRVVGEADSWWRLLNANDEATVCELVNDAFADNAASGFAVGVDGTTLHVVMRQPDLDTLPDRMPATTPAGRPTLKALTKRDALTWWFTTLGGNVIATVKEALATAPAVECVNVAVLTRIPTTRRLGVVVHGEWTRRAVEHARWRTEQDALRFLDVGREVRCSVRIPEGGRLAAGIKALEIVPGDPLADLLDRIDEDAASPGALADLDAALGEERPAPGPALPNPYAVVPFSAWKQRLGDGASDLPAARQRLHQALDGAVTHRQLAEGPLSLELPAGSQGDLSVLLLGPEGKVVSDSDFIFYNHLSTPNGAVSLHTAGSDADLRTTRAVLRLAALSEHIERVAVVLSVPEAAAGLAGTRVRMDLPAADAHWHLDVPGGSTEPALVLGEFLRAGSSHGDTWQFRAVCSGWTDGLVGLLRAHGVEVDE
ncbi:hypothetical protein BIV57_00645 [Mangrovactinospora gilvigrisea]|uniref:TerD domain-containing protein n=1 Tax=Mangrovactinospora gilvigrisea TaxID=1428644 RepID=A0A1J7CIC4_9ACTN|nr:TerD family protein [Mangrovactinospora gilvigrisea]OIV39386.1 hypothetical protein BIV57_00645 [Mangrovactinospora gilvigrisea]